MSSVSHQENASSTPLTTASSGSAGFMQNARSLGTIKGIPILLHPTFFVLAALQTVSGFSAGAAGAFHGFLVYGPILFCTVLTHELGHSLMTQKLGGQVDQILLWPLGGLAFCGGVGSPAEDLKVAIAGPVTHVPQALVWLVLLLLSNGGSTQSPRNFLAVVCLSAVYQQVGLACFNLLPAFPLDGGRAFAAFLVIRHVEAAKAARIISGTAMTLAAALLIWGFVLLGQGQVAAVVNLLVAAWVMWQSWQLWKAQEQGQVYQHPLFARDCLLQTRGHTTVRGHVAETVV
jgi:Zn-dependent protease